MPRKRNERTSPRVASQAGRLLRDLKTKKRVKSVAGSALSHAEGESEVITAESLLAQIEATR